MSPQSFLELTCSCHQHYLDVYIYDYDWVQDFAHVSISQRRRISILVIKGLFCHAGFCTHHLLPNSGEDKQGDSPLSHIQ
jgi:hypothetical protein